MLDLTIPFYNIILRCDHYRYHTPALSNRYSIVPYQKGYEKSWAELEYTLGDFESPEKAESYFTATYLQNRDLLGNILFLVTDKNKVIGSCIAWQDLRNGMAVASLHWLVVAEEYQGRGLGKALCYAVMNLFAGQNRLPVYIHTQPWSRKAIFLYLSVGFRLQKTDSFSHYCNEYDKAMVTLQKITTREQYSSLLNASDE